MFHFIEWKNGLEAYLKKFKKNHPIPRFGAKSGKNRKSCSLF